MIEEIRRCEVCGLPYHEEPLVGHYGLTCPTEAASEEDKEAYRLAREEHRWVAERFGTDIANRPEVAELIIARKNAAQDRVDNPQDARALISQEVLAADIKSRLPEIEAAILAESLLEPVEFEPDAPHLTVPGEVPNRPPIIRNRPGAPGYNPGQTLETGDSKDYLMYFGEDE